MTKKVLYYLQKYDGVWSIPLAFLGFFMAGRYGYEYFGDALISTEYIQVVFMAALILIFANFVVFLGINFNFRSLQRYFYSTEIKEQIKNELTVWQRIKLYLFVYFCFLVLFLFIVWLLMTVTVSGLQPTLMSE
jgi:ABC-type uncharacterized transport system permease subunit